MLIKAKDLRGYKLDARDGSIGSVEDFYFDDRFWTIRYMVADTGGWLPGKEVLLSPISLVAINGDSKMISVDLSKKQIASSPSIDTNKPVSRQFEEEYYGYYGMPNYWAGPYSWGAYSYPMRDPANSGGFNPGGEKWDADLRSTRDVTGHHVQATDGEIGHVEDFIIDPESWAIRYLVVTTKNWWPGKKVLISPQWVDRVSWIESKVFVSLSRDRVQKAPLYTDDIILERHYESDLFGSYGQPGYWEREVAARP